MGEGLRAGGPLGGGKSIQKGLGRWIGQPDDHFFNFGTKGGWVRYLGIPG